MYPVYAHCQLARPQHPLGLQVYVLRELPVARPAWRPVEAEEYVST